MSLRLARVGLALLLCTAAGRAPAGFWTGPASAPVPDDIAGGSVIHTEALAALLKTGRVILVDVAAAAKRPPNLPAGRIWMPLPHRDIPGSIWIPGVGDGVIGAAADAEFRARLLKLTGGRMDAPLVVYCHHACWLSWNAAKRAIGYGFKRVIWYPDGVEGWAASGRTLAATPFAEDR